MVGAVKVAQMLPLPFPKEKPIHAIVYHHFIYDSSRNSSGMATMDTNGVDYRHQVRANGIP